MSKPIKLVRCPICGGFGRPVRYSDQGQYLVTCKTNGCKSVIGRTYHDAVRLWNEPRFSDAKP